ncbi:sialidase-3 [Gastrophryne carolinensis]
MAAAQALFQREASGVTYRIPGLLYIEQHSMFLAFAEKRSSPKDSHALYLVMRRGEDRNGEVQWEAMTDVANAKLPGHRTMNPCPVYDRDTNTIFLFFICVVQHWSELAQIFTGRNAARLCYITSTDHGRSWSHLVDVTEEVLGNDLKNCATLAVGPGHGIQYSNGQLVLPAYLYYIHCRVCGIPVPWTTNPHAFVFFSDNHGKTWERGNFVWKQKTCECEVAEISCSEGPGILYCSARTSHYFRVKATSKNRGLEFDDSCYCESLCETPHGCQGSVVSYEPAEVHQKADENDGRRTFSWLLYSHPTSHKKRVNLGIYLNRSPLKSDGWNQPWIINEGPSGYSDLAVCQSSHAFGCLFERGADADEIMFRKFTVGELLKNLPEY